MPRSEDERGRVLIPKSVREATGLVPGRRIVFEPRSEGVLVRPASEQAVTLGRLVGVINPSTRRRAVPADDSLVAKGIWASSP